MMIMMIMTMIMIIMITVDQHSIDQSFLHLVHEPQPSHKALLEWLIAPNAYPDHTTKVVKSLKTHKYDDNSFYLSTNRSSYVKS